MHVSRERSRFIVTPYRRRKREKYGVRKRRDARGSRERETKKIREFQRKNEEQEREERQVEEFYRRREAVREGTVSVDELRLQCWGHCANPHSHWSVRAIFGLIRRLIGMLTGRE